MTQKSSGSKPKLRRAKSLLAAKEPAKKKKATKTATSRAKTKTAAGTKTAAKSKTTATRTRKKAADGLDQQIAEKAFELYQRRGNCHGLDQYDWDLADKLVQLEASRSKLKTKKRLRFDANDEKTRERIAQKAFELYEMKGYIGGTDEYDWYVAEQLVRLES